MKKEGTKKNLLTKIDDLTDRDIVDIITPQIRKLTNVRPTLAGQRGTELVKGRLDEAHRLRRVLKNIGREHQTGR